MFGKDFTDPMTLLTALGITLVSVLRRYSKWRIYWRDFSNHHLWFSNGASLPAAMIVGTLVDPMATLLNANGDVVSAMVITRVSEGKKWLSAVVATK
jgi:hypothetical protein